jgi:hypothetical protein
MTLSGNLLSIFQHFLSDQILRRTMSFTNIYPITISKEKVIREQDTHKSDIKFHSKCKQKHSKPLSGIHLLVTYIYKLNTNDSQRAFAMVYAILKLCTCIRSFCSLTDDYNCYSTFLSVMGNEEENYHCDMTLS